MNLLFNSFAAILNVDDSVVDLETLEALYENVSDLCNCIYMYTYNILDIFGLFQISF